MQRGPPRPRTNSLPLIWINRRPFDSRIALVMVFRLYTTTTPGAMIKVLEPSFHYSRPAATIFSPPQRIKSTFSTPKFAASNAAKSPCSSSI